MRPTENFEPLAASFKRIRNILRQAEFAGGGAISSGPARAGTRNASSIPNSSACAGAARTLEYQPALETIASIRPKVDLFFDKVLVNAPDEQVRQNRLALLSTLLAEFSTIADFSEIVTNS